jgi:tetratricopeptide (TPR) repeat protein
MGGIGKSVLAAAFACASATRRALEDGIVWVSVGLDSEPWRIMREVGVVFGQKPAQYEKKNLEKAEANLRMALKDKNCLVVLDDVWDIDVVGAFRNALGPLTRLLVTTRNEEIGILVEAQSLTLDILTSGEALALLAKWSEKPLADLPPEAEKVANECGNLPLTLSVVGAALQNVPDRRWRDVLQQLESAELDEFNTLLPLEYKKVYNTLFRAIEVSLEVLDPTVEKQKLARECYLDFAVFPKNASIPEATLEILWKALEASFGSVLDVLVRRCLLQRDQEDRIRIHHLQQDYVTKKAGDLKTLHSKLIEAYGEHCNYNWPSGPNDGYFFQNLPYHMGKAMRLSDLEKMLLDYTWLQKKLETTSHRELIDDYEGLAEKKIGDRDRVSDLIDKSDKGNLEDKVNICRELGAAYDILGERGQALQMLAQANHLVTELDNEILQAGVLTQLGQSWFHVGKFDNCTDALQKAMEIFKSHKSELQDCELLTYGECLQWNGINDRNREKLDLSLALHTEARNVAESVTDEALKLNSGRLKAHATANIGAVYLWDKKYEKVLTMWQEALEISKRIDDKPWITHYTIAVFRRTLRAV